MASPVELALSKRGRSVSVTEADPVPVSNAASATVIGTTSDLAWDGVSANATVIALLKAIALNTGTT